MIFDLSATDEPDETYGNKTDRSATIREYLKEKTIELNSLDELIAFIKEIDCEIVVSMYDDNTPEIEIYNGYRE